MGELSKKLGHSFENCAHSWKQVENPGYAPDRDFFWREVKRAH